MNSVDGILEGMQRYMNEPVKYDVLQMKQTVDTTCLIVNTVLGIIVWALVVLIILVTACDVIYLTVPLVRSKVDSAGLAGKAVNGKFRLVSHDVDKAIERATYNGDVSPLREYLKIRIWTHIFVACLLTFILSGGWEWIKDFLRPIIETIVSFFY